MFIFSGQAIACFFYLSYARLTGWAGNPQMIIRAGCAAARGDFMWSFLVRSLLAAGFYLSHGMPNDYLCCLPAQRTACLLTRQGVCGCSWAFHRVKCLLPKYLKSKSILLLPKRFL
jgi:hypothetical protein